MKKNKKEEKIVLPLKKLLSQHYLKTGEYITQTWLAEELVKKGFFKNSHSAINSLQYYMQGKRNIKIEILHYLSKRFNLTIDQILEL